DLADQNGVILAVNQNGRWAPHFSWMREAVYAGLIGDLQSCHLSVHWDHSWIAGTSFEEIDDLILYDFAIHWFDFLISLIGNRAREVYATRHRAAGQSIRPPTLAQALVAFEGGQAAFLFDAATRFAPQDRTVITGTNGTLSSQGPDLQTQDVSLTTAKGMARPKLQGTWFKEGFLGTMGALLKAVEDGARPLNNARSNLDALALAFAAIASANRGAAVTVGSIRNLDAARGTST
ncbi:MAG: Gfo/Idh/MocA family oxidoreductase, partial [Pseudomonadota bacterium]